MLLYSDVKTEIQSRLVDSDDLLTDAWFQRQVWDAYAFLVLYSGGYWLKEEGTFSTVASTQAYSLSSDVWIPTQMIDTTNRRVVDRCEYEEEAFLNPDRSASSQPSGYYRIANRGVSAQPTSASVLAVSSSSASDVTPLTVRVRGLVSGLEVTTTVTVTGVTPVSTTGYSFTRVYEINKSAAFTGTLTVTSNAAAVTNLTLPPEPLFADFQWIRFMPTMPAVYAMRYLYIRKPTNVTQSTDRFEVPSEMEEPLMLCFEAKARRHYQEFSKSEQCDAKNIALIRERSKAFNFKSGTYVKNIGSEAVDSDFLMDVYRWNLR